MSTKAKTAAAAALLLVQTLLTCACWSNRDLTNINIVSAIGLDRTESGRILLTVQVVEPVAIQSTSSGRGKGGVQAQQKPVFVESVEADTVSGAFSDMLSTVDQKLFFSAAQVLVLGERLCMENICEVLDYFAREHEASYKMDVLVARGSTPREILETETDMDSIPAVYIKGTIETNAYRATSKQTILVDLIKDLNSDGRQPAVGAVEKAGDREIRTEGVAVFRDGNLAGWLDKRETRGYMLALGKGKGAVVTVPISGGKIAAEIRGSVASVSVRLENSQLAALTVSASVDACLAEFSGSGSLDSLESLRGLEAALSEEIKKEISAAVTKAQKEYSSDIFGFGERLRKFSPQCWKTVRDRWHKTFSSLPCEIQVAAKIKRLGMIRGPVCHDVQ